MDDYDGVRRYGGAYGRKPFSFAKTDFSYIIHCLLSLQSQLHPKKRESVKLFVYKNVTQIVLLFAKCLDF